MERIDLVDYRLAKIEDDNARANVAQILRCIAIASKNSYLAPGVYSHIVNNKMTELGLPIFSREKLIELVDMMKEFGWLEIYTRKGEKFIRITGRVRRWADV